MDKTSKTSKTKKTDSNLRAPRSEVKKELDKRSENIWTKKEAYAAYDKRKAHARLLEAANDSRIIVFASVDKPWYKIGWNSALFYAYDVAIRACSKKDLPTVRVDTDLDVSMRSKDGIIFLRNLENFIKRLEKIGITKYEKLNDDIYVFELKRKYTNTEIKGFRKIAYKSGEELFSMVAKKTAYPELKTLITKAISTTLPKMDRLSSFYASAMGARVFEAIDTMNQSYFEMTNGWKDKNESLTKIVEAANTILGELVILNELKVVNIISLMDIGKVMVDIKMAVQRIMKSGEKTDGAR